jgi:hypothetical protein
MLTPYSRQKHGFTAGPFARNNAEIFGKLLAALDIKENTNSKESHILNDYSLRRIHISYLIVYGGCESHAKEKPTDKEKRQVTLLSDKSESEMLIAAIQQSCGVNELTFWFSRR